MKCKKCGSENIIKYGPRRGKPCYLCKDCTHQFTSETAKYNDCDKNIAIRLYDKYTRYKKKNNFINAELRLSHIAKILNCKYTSVDYWVGVGRHKIKRVTAPELVDYIKAHEDGRDIWGLLCPDKVHYQPSKKLLKIIKCQD